MRIVLSIDMEGTAGISSVRELLACCPEYWDTGRARLTDDVLAAASGLLDGGASEVIILDNHASGHPTNLIADHLPSGGAGRHRERLRPSPGRHRRDAADRLPPAAQRRRLCPHTYIPGLRL